MKDTYIHDVLSENVPFGIFFVVVIVFIVVFSLQYVLYVV